ncbi:MAG: hypothetical protein NTV01_04240 [Bacteroidia bacterium]|nr:hypothetical protein [Bacteroidia bacterium]
MPTLIDWKGQTLNSPISIESSRKSIGRITKDALNGILSSYLKSNGWTVEPVGSDHYRESDYRVMAQATKDGQKVFYLFTAHDLKDGDWKENLYFLNQIPTENSQCNYDLFFSQIIEYLKDSVKIPKEVPNCISARISDTVSNYEFNKKLYQAKVFLFCNFSSSSKGDDYSCFQDLRYNFYTHLEKNGYSMELLSDESMPGWDNRTYQAQNGILKFYFKSESESTSSMGYVSIIIFDDL